MTIILASIISGTSGYLLCEFVAWRKVMNILPKATKAARIAETTPIHDSMMKDFPERYAMLTSTDSWK